MESALYDVYYSVKELIYTGNYSQALQEISNTDIDENDVSALARSNLYRLICYIEENNSKAAHELLQEIKAEPNLKVYYRVLYLLTTLVLLDKLHENVFEKTLAELDGLTAFNDALMPVIYSVSLILIRKENYAAFLTLADKTKQDLEMMNLTFLMFLKLNNLPQMEKTLNLMKIVGEDNVLTKINSLVFELYSKNDTDKADEIINIVKGNSKISLKLFNLIAAVLMSKGNFGKAAKALKLAKENQEKLGESNNEYVSVIVNLICCLRNEGDEEGVKSLEENLKNVDPNNAYFERLASANELLLAIK